MINLKTIYSHSPRIVARNTGDEYVLVPVTNNIADMKSVYTLNSTAAFLWDKLDGIKPVQEIINDLKSEFDVDHEQAMDDVLNFLQDLQDYLIIIE